MPGGIGPPPRLSSSAAMARLMTGSRRVLALAVVAGAVAGCGATTSVGSSRSVEIGLTEYRVTPQRIQAPAGQLSIYIRNRGRLTHNLSVNSGGQSVDSTKPIPPGRSAWLYLDLAPGSYTIASTLFSDQALGAYGTLVVH
jgi:Cupredoxin-like domain